MADDELLHPPGFRIDSPQIEGPRTIVVCNNCNDTGLMPTSWFEEQERLGKRPDVVCQRCGTGRMLPPTYTPASITLVNSLTGNGQDR